MPQAMSREMFRLWAPLQCRRYERVDGVPVAMSRQGAAHVRAKSRVWLALREAIEAGGADCEALGDGVTVEVDDETDYEPDAIVNCGARLHGEAFAADNPVVVVEILSPIVQSIDLHQKLSDYFRVPSVHHYFVVTTLSCGRGGRR